MKNLIFVFVVFVSSCAPRYSYKYKYAMESTMRDSAMYYVDSNVEVLLKVRRDRIEFVMQNMTDETLKINWDESVIVFDGVAKKVTHSGIKLMSTDRLMPVSVIPATARLEDFVIPAENVATWARPYESNIVDMFPKYEHVANHNEFEKSVKGLKFFLYLPVLKKSEQINYVFRFRVEDVVKQRIANPAN